MISIEAIQQHVAVAFGIHMIDMKSERRHRTVARPRQVAMYLCRELTTRSYPRIGFVFGNRDHTTVMAAVHRIEDLIENDPEFAAKVAAVRQELETEPEHV